MWCSPTRSLLLPVLSYYTAVSCNPTLCKAIQPYNQCQGWNRLVQPIHVQWFLQESVTCIQITSSNSVRSSLSEHVTSVKENWTNYPWTLPLIKCDKVKNGLVLRNCFCVDGGSTEKPPDKANVFLFLSGSPLVTTLSSWCVSKVEMPPTCATVLTSHQLGAMLFCLCLRPLPALPRLRGQRGDQALTPSPSEDIQVGF